MGRDKTASKRMAAMRSREKAAGLRRLNVAIDPAVLTRLAELMQQHNCVSQARMIELLVLSPPLAQPQTRQSQPTSRLKAPMPVAIAPLSPPAPKKAAPVVQDAEDVPNKKAAPKKLKELLKKSAPPVKAKPAAKTKKATPPPPAKVESNQLSLF